ncbi:uncharacterized protein LOC135197828 [Macrobrachium nipponense]|uniref:uncharacterized protein LOC135197828 n=1 Tax=Macrobrachium nipponense TaxID=159736 RepID=UPI0030C8CE11
MSSGIGLPVFHAGEEDFASFLEQLECYFVVKDVEESKKFHTLIVGLQPRQYQVLKDLGVPATPVSKTYDVLTALLRKHYCGTTNPRVERTKFRQVMRREGETLQAFSVRLKHEARHCEFGDSQMLVDQLIAGVHSKCIANKLLECKEGLDLTFDKALQIAEATEVNERNAAFYARSGNGSQSAVHKTLHVNKIYSRQSVQKKKDDVKPVYHLANVCKFRDSECRKCHRMGHIAVACRQGKVPKSQHQVDVGLNQTVNVVNESTLKPDVPELQRLNLNVTNNARLNPAGHNVNGNEYHIFEINDVLKLDVKTDLKLHTSSKYFANMNLNNVDIDFELDTGAAVTCVGEYTFKKFCNSREELQAIDIALTDYNKQPLEILEWASPTNNIVKSDGKNVRIWADFKETLNPVCSIDSYPLPIPEDIFATLARGESFTKLDLSHAYHQLKMILLQYGLNCAVGIFQRVMENVLKDIPNVAVYLDDIVITGPIENDHLKTLELVLHKLCSNGLKLKKDKCSFMNKEVQYLGHKLDAEGVHASDEKVKAIDQFSVPMNKQELSTFNGMVKSLFLTCDASSFGLGAVLEQEGESGSLKPVSYASRTLTRSEKNYSQTEKEGLSVIWAVNKFHKYLYGRKFEIWTDHKSLLGLLGDGKAVPHIASGRIIRWSLVLSGYDYKLKYKPGCKIPNADCLSRFPMQINEFEPPNVGEEVLLLEHVDTTNVNSSDIRRWTDRDPVLSQVRSCILNGWDDNFELNEDYQPYVS